MVAKPKVLLELETEWIREYARTYLPTEGAFVFSPEVLRRAKVALVSIRNVLRSGRVVFSEKLDEPGALWVLEGDDGNGIVLRLEIVVVSEILSVRLQAVARCETQRSEDDKVEVREKGNDAA